MTLNFHKKPQRDFVFHFFFKFLLFLIYFIFFALYFFFSTPQLDRAVITTGQDSLESDSEETARAGPRGR
jgi:hypothetical protein